MVHFSTSFLSFIFTPECWNLPNVYPFMHVFLGLEKKSVLFQPFILPWRSKCEKPFLKIFLSKLIYGILNQGLLLYLFIQELYSCVFEENRHNVCCAIAMFVSFLIWAIITLNLQKNPEFLTWREECSLPAVHIQGLFSLFLINNWLLCLTTIYLCSRKNMLPWQQGKGKWLLYWCDQKNLNLSNHS